MNGKDVFVAVTVPVRANRTGVPQIVFETGYQLGLQLTGCTALTLSTALDPGHVDELFEMADGLLLTGGEDLHPARYGEKPRGARDVSPKRDALEWELATRALERGLPVLAICRGMQLLNALLGGDLYQDLSSEWSEDLRHDRYELWDGHVHTIEFEDPRWLRGIAPDGRVRTNSAHHQGIKNMAGPLRAVAWAEDGLVEAVEYGDDAWTVGVQWHPERLLGSSDDEAASIHAALFRRFGTEVHRAARARGRSQGPWTERTGA